MTAASSWRKSSRSMANGTCVEVTSLCEASGYGLVQCYEPATTFRDGVRLCEHDAGLVDQEQQEADR